MFTIIFLSSLTIYETSIDSPRLTFSGPPQEDQSRLRGLADSLDLHHVVLHVSPSPWNGTGSEPRKKHEKITNYPNFSRIRFLYFFWFLVRCVFIFMFVLFLRVSLGFSTFGPSENHTSHWEWHCENHCSARPRRDQKAGWKISDETLKPLVAFPAMFPYQGLLWKSTGGSCADGTT